MNDSEAARTKAVRKAAADECGELILRLWEKRSAWPQGWPPPSAATVLETLADPDPSPWAYREDVEQEDANSWLATFPLLQELQSSEIDVWRQAALAEVDVEDAREWLKKHGKQMEVDERETLEDFVRAADTSRERAERFASLRGKKKPTKQSDFAARIRELSSKRAKLVKQADSGTKPVKITPEPSSKSRTRRRRMTSD